MSDGAAGPDGALRCPWALSTEDYVSYHDKEWGRPVHGDDALYERLCLEAFQSGLSWITILRRRPGFRAAFADFEIASVAAFTDADKERLLGDPGIIRNRAKIEATVANARVLADWAPGELDELDPSFAPDPAARPAPEAAGRRPGRHRRVDGPLQDPQEARHPFRWVRPRRTRSCRRAAWSTTTWRIARPGAPLRGAGNCATVRGRPGVPVPTSDRRSWRSVTAPSTSASPC